MPIPLGILAVAGSGGGALTTSYDLLATTVTSGNVGEVIFSGLGSYSDYKHLQIRMSVKERQTGTNLRDLGIQFNSDSGVNYYRHTLWNASSTVESVYGSSNLIQIQNFVPAADVTNNYGLAIIDILDFSNTSKNKTIRSFSGGTNSTENNVSLVSGFWNNTAAITSIRFVPITYEIGPSSRFSIYGLKG